MNHKGRTARFLAKKSKQMVTDVANKDDYECEKNGDLLWLDRGFSSQSLN